MNDILTALTNLQPLRQVQVVVLDIIYLFVQVLGHVSVGIVKVLNIIISYFCPIFFNTNL